MATELTPRVKTTITGEGTVVLHDVTRKGLHRLKVERSGEYPDFEIWKGMLPKDIRLVGSWAEEVMTPNGFTGVMWIYYKVGMVERTKSDE